MNTLLAILLSAQVVMSHRSIVAPTPVSGGAAPTYLFEESFEGEGYENSWVNSDGLWDEDSTGQAADGSQSCYSTSPEGNARADADDAWTAASGTTYAFFAVYIDAIGTTQTFFILRDAGEATVCYLQFRTDFAVRAYHGTGWASTSTGAFAVDEWTYVWLEYTPGSGADGTFDVRMSNTTTRPEAASVYVSNGTATNDPVGIRLQNPASSASDLYFDYILIDDVVISP